jgi:hypothetical protein
MFSSLVMPQVLDAYQNPDPVYVYGEPLCDFGLCNRMSVNGLGLVTRGLLWQLWDIYFDVDYYSTISTTWTNVQFGAYGDYPPT